jgi:hypothetical protein
MHFAGISFALLLFVALLADASASAACDFSLPFFRMTSSLSKPTYFPPFPVLSAQSRYSWTCRPPSNSRGFPFNVQLSASVPVAGMLALAFQENVSFSAQVILTDDLDDDVEWGVDAHAVLNHFPENSPALPTLQLGFSADACGCVKRVRFTWDAREAADGGSCEAPISVQPDVDRSDNSCFPSWAFESSFDSKKGTEPQSKRSAPGLLTDLPSSHPCSPDLSNDVPLSHKKLRTVSFDGHCKYLLFFALLGYRLPACTC